MSGNPLGDLLGSILGGASKSAGGAGGGGGGLLGSILGALGGSGGAGGGGAQAQGSNPLSQLFDMFSGPQAEPEVKEAAKSWVATGDNQPLTPQQLSNVLPTEAVHQAAEANGLTDDQALNELSRQLPEVINEATPNGSMTDFDSILDKYQGGQGGWNQQNAA